MPASAQEHELDRGPTSIGPGGERFCALTRSLKPVGEMIRFVVGPDGAAVPDVKRKLPGRGIWITATRGALDEAVKRKVFARGFKWDVRVAGDIAGTTERLLERSALDALAIAGKAGLVLAGTTKVEVAIGRGEPVALIHAADAAADGTRKIAAILQRQAGALAQEMPIITAFTSAQLDLALNRPNVVHAALLAGPVSATFVARSLRLERFRTGTFSQSRGPDRARESRTE